MKFDFYSVGRIIFGRGQCTRIGELASELGGKTALVVYNGGESVVARVAERLAGAGVGAVSCRQSGEPTVEHVDRALETAKHKSCDLIIGIGGGSAIDAAKAVAGLLGNGGSSLDYMEVVGRGQKITRAAIPWIAVPTTAGTGAEVTRNAVIGYPPKQFKASLRSEHLLPRIALIDPELGVDVPAHVTASSGMDALCQCIESYTSTGATPMTDPLALEGIKRAARSLKNAYACGANLDAREDMAMAALLSGICLTNAGLGAVHGFAAPLGATFPVPHGTVCAALLPHVMAANVAALRAADSAHPVLKRYAKIGRVLANQDSLSDEHAMDAGIAAVRQLVAELNIPRLGNFELTAADVPALCTLARRSSSMKFNPVVLSDDALASILQTAI